jgi:hypothetical protein
VRSISLDELSSGPAFWTSSLSLVVAIRSIDGLALPSSDTAEKVMSELALALSRGNGIDS